MSLTYACDVKLSDQWSHVTEKLPMLRTDATQLSSMKLKEGTAFLPPLFLMTMPDIELMNFPNFGSEPDVLPETTSSWGNASPDAEVEARQVN